MGIKEGKTKDKGRLTKFQSKGSYSSRAKEVTETRQLNAKCDPGLGKKIALKVWGKNSSKGRYWDN